MEIDQRSDESVYITIGDWVFYIDNSTDEQIVEKWKEKEHGKSKGMADGNGGIRRGQKQEGIFEEVPR